MKTRGLVSKIGDSSSGSRAANHGVSGPSFEHDGPQAHASSLAHRSPTNVRVSGFFSGECRKKHATVLALSTDKSSSLSHQETGGRNPHEALEYNSPSPRLCQWHLHATWSILELERGRCRLYHAPNVSTSKQRLLAHLNNGPRAVSGAAARPVSK